MVKIEASADFYFLPPEDKRQQLVIRTCVSRDMNSQCGTFEFRNQVTTSATKLEAKLPTSGFEPMTS